MENHDSITLRDIVYFVLASTFCLVMAPIAIPVIVWKYRRDNKDQK